MKQVTIYAVVSVLFGLFGPVTAFAATTPPLGAAASFAVLAGSTIVDSNPSVVTGDVGLSPAAGSFIGIPTAEVTGTIYAVDGTGPLGSVNNPTLLTTAKNNLTAAYTDAANQVPVSTIASELGGATITPGAYNSADGTFQITGTVTLDAQGNPDAIFIFNTTTTLTTAANSIVLLANGAQACNIYWRVGSSAVLGTTSAFKGSIFADQSITDNGGSTVQGRLLARVAAVTLNNSTITVPVCASSGGSSQGNGTINVVKTVINDNGGTRTAASFSLFVNGTSVVSGVTNTFPAPALRYDVTEGADPNYVRSFSGDCDSNGGVNLVPGDNKFCIVTNNDIGAPAVPPLIDVVKVPSPLALPLGPGSVTYTYTLRNVGTVPVSDVTLVGDTCGPIVRVSGDSNGDNVLDINETWVHTCSTTLSVTHTNTVVATGWANGISATDIASATVVVGAPITPPLIHVTKVPNPLALRAAGGMVTYTYVVTNPGTEPLHNVTIVDDKCTGLPGRVIGHPGDLNKNDLLESNESWSFTCRSSLSQTTTNTAIASGEANGMTVRDFAIATVVVAAPGFPRAGFMPMSDVLMRFGALVVSIGVLIPVLRKRRA